ncbi:hypothetical protein GN244_ATG15287 [Phytophthora infestans]|uniref:Uncharacterized protein n=1 Tax=Phytophthora infestans TaxID=4787 RepID=A0A833WFY8_PHYIN|nr:hypothetical protein GN244_ATG15287 [Phytophthora infestans]
MGALFWEWGGLLYGSYIGYNYGTRYPQGLVWLGISLIFTLVRHRLGHGSDRLRDRTTNSSDEIFWMKWKYRFAPIMTTQMNAKTSQGGYSEMDLVAAFWLSRFSNCL